MVQMPIGAEGASRNSLSTVASRPPAGPQGKRYCHPNISNLDNPHDAENLRKTAKGIRGIRAAEGPWANRRLFGIQPKEPSTIFDPQKVSAASEFIATDRVPQSM